MEDWELEQLLPKEGNLSSRAETLLERLEGFSNSELSDAIATKGVKRTKGSLRAAFVLEQLVWPLTIPQLKKECKELGLPVSGAKGVLVARIAEKLKLDGGIVTEKKETPREKELKSWSREQLERELEHYDLTYQKGNKADMRRKILHAEKYRMKRRKLRTEPVVRHTAEPFVPGESASILHVPHDVLANIASYVTSFRDGRAMALSCKHLYQPGLAVMDAAAQRRYGAGANRRTELFYSRLRRRCSWLNKTDAKTTFRLRDSDLSRCRATSHQKFAFTKTSGWRGRSRDVYVTEYQYQLPDLLRACLARWETWDAFERAERLSKRRKRK